jgi:MFS family permease
MRSLLLISVTAMLAQQTMATVSKTAVPVLFKPIADEFGFEAELVLAYTWTFACAGIIVMLGCGGYIIRYGALRMSQVGCVLMAIGLLAALLSGHSATVIATSLAATAILVSIGATVATPASSQILARYAPPRWAPLVFSIKQTGVPAGVVAASLIAPLIAVHYGWRGALIVLALAGLLIAVALQPFQREFDQDRRPDHPLVSAGITSTARAVWAHAELRMLAICAFAFVGLQAIYTNFTVVYLTERVSLDLVSAGALLGTATIVAAPGRIIWGWVGSTWLRPRTLIAMLSIGMAIAGSAIGQFDNSWPTWLLMLPLLGLSATALSWHGLLLSEVARVAPSLEVGRLTGGVLAFGTAGQVVYPGLFWFGYVLGEYPGAYLMVSAPAAVLAVFLLRPRGR